MIDDLEEKFEDNEKRGRNRGKRMPTVPIRLYYEADGCG
jgi:hypothetical protein